MHKTVNVVSAVMHAAFPRTWFVAIAALILAVPLAKADDSNLRSKPQIVPSRVQSVPKGATPPSAPFISPQQRGRLIDALRLLEPVNIHPTTDLRECGTHGGVLGGAILCQSLLPKGELILVWDWNGSENIDGYHIYKWSAPNSETLVGTQSLGKGFTMFAVPPPPGGYGSACYDVAAFMGGKESAIGIGPCSGRSLSLVQTASLPLTRSAGVTTHYKGATGAFSMPGYSDTGDGAIEVGHELVALTYLDGDMVDNTYYRTAMLFDVSGLVGKTIRSAHLKLSVDSTSKNGVTNTDSCIRRISQPPGLWTANKDLIWQSQPLAQFDEFAGPDMAYDVTSIVKSWAAGAPNNGLVLEDNAEVRVSRGVFVNDTCTTLFVSENTRLEVEYQ